MLTMTRANCIKELYENKEKSLREIADITGHSFRTVRKYAYQADWNSDNLPGILPASYPVLGDFIPIIDGWLEADRKVPRKQRHTAIKVFDRLRREHGFQGSYSSVKKYFRKKKYLMRQSSEGFLPLSHPKGHAQIDFGEFMYHDVRGETCKGYALTISFPYSNAGFTQVFPSQNQECLLTGMRRIFERIGGVPLRLRADNMSSAVVKVLKGSERILSDGFVRFKLHYRFEADFCNPASGHDKQTTKERKRFESVA